MSADHPDLPEEIAALFENGAPGEDIILDRNGAWRRGGDPLRDERIIDFLNRSVAAVVDGSWCIRYGHRTRAVKVEDTPVFVTGVRFNGIFLYEKITLELSSGKSELLDIYTLSYENNSLYCKVENGALRAKFMRHPSYQILGRIDEVDGLFYLNLCGEKILIERK